MGDGGHGGGMLRPRRRHGECEGARVRCGSDSVIRDGDRHGVRHGVETKLLARDYANKDRNKEKDSNQRRVS